MVRRCQDGCDVEEDGDGRLNPGGVPQNEINGEGNQFNYAATSEREDQDGDCLAFLCLPVMSCHMNREVMRLSGEHHIRNTYIYVHQGSLLPAAKGSHPQLTLVSSLRRRGVSRQRGVESS